MQLALEFLLIGERTALGQHAILRLDVNGVGTGRLASPTRPHGQLAARGARRRNAGREAFEVVWGPMLEAKFSASARQASMVWFWGKVALRGASRSGGRRRSSERWRSLRFSSTATSSSIQSAAPSR